MSFLSRHARRRRQVAGTGHTRHWVDTTEACKYIIRRVLYASTRDVESAGCLRDKAGKQETVRNVGHCTKNQVRSHRVLREALKLVKGACTCDQHSFSSALGHAN